MSLFFMVQLVLTSDCFKLNTKCIYNAQRSILQFEAIPSKSLTGEEKQLCETVVHGQKFELQVELGSIIFSTTGLTYDKDNDINVEVPCQGDINTCAADKVTRVQAATYKLIFQEIDLTLTSIINLYEISRYNHLNCIRTTNLIYDGVKQTMEVQVQDPVIKCPCEMINTSNNSSHNVFIVSKLSGNDISVSPYKSDDNYSGIIKFNNNGNNNSTTPSDLKKFWQEIVGLGPYNSTQLPLINMLLQYIRTTPVLELAMRVSVLTEIKQIRDPTNNTPNTSFYYNQSIQYSMASLTNQNQADCFTGVDIELHKTFFYVNTVQNFSATKCSKEYIENVSSKKYDHIKMQIIASQNRDKSAFNYHVSHILDNFELGQDLNQRFQCLNDEDCAKLQQIAKIHRHYYNMSVSMKLLFVNNGTINFAISYTANFTLTSYNQTNVSILGDYVCIEIQPQSIGAQQIDFELFKHKFDLSQYMSTSQKSYCSTMDNKQKEQVKKIISSMKGNIDIQPHTFLTVGNSIVGDIQVIVYENPKENSLVWGLCVMFAALAAIGALGVGLGFRKKVDVWETGHTLMQVQE